MNRVLVTGASGFIGRALCRSLQGKGIQVVALNRMSRSGPWNDEAIADLADLTLDTKQLENCEAVIHLAGIAHSNVSNQDEYDRINVQGTVQMAKKAIAARIRRFVFVSSTKATPFAEKKVVTGDAYGQSKYMAELELQRLADSSDLNLTIIRPALIYGVGVKGNLDKLIKAIDRGWLPPLPETDHGISMISMNDVIEAIEKIMSDDAAISGTYTLADGQIYSARRIFNEITSGFDRKVPRWSFPMFLVRSAALFGDLVEQLFKARMPVNKEVIEKLFADSSYSADEITAATGWQPTQVFADVVPEMISQYTAKKGSGVREW